MKLVRCLIAGAVGFSLVAALAVERRRAVRPKSLSLVKP
jgi:hypothetical protein